MKISLIFLHYENIQIQKGRPIAVKGQDVFRCERLDKDSDGNPVDLGYVGSITGVESARLKKYLKDDYMPIVSPIGCDRKGQLYNTNADTAAAHLAAAIGARRLVYLCDVPGLLRDKDDPSSLISSISQEEVPAMKAEGIIGSGMLPKVESAINALTSGVHRVHLIGELRPS